MKVGNDTNHPANNGEKKFISAILSHFSHELSQEALESFRRYRAFIEAICEAKTTAEVQEEVVLEVDYIHENDSDRADKTGSAHPYLPTGQQPGQSLMPAPDTRSVSCSGKWKNYRDRKGGVSEASFTAFAKMYLEAALGDDPSPQCPQASIPYLAPHDSGHDDSTSGLSMNSAPILEEIYVINAYDDSSFIKEDHSRRIHPNDPTRVAVFPAETNRDTKFEPFPVETRSFRINTLPPTSLQLFQLFLPISLVEKLVQYIKVWVMGLKENGVADSWKHPMKRTASLRKWEGTSVAEVYVSAQQGFFIRWLWHIKEAKYGAAGVELPPPNSSTQGRAGRGRGRGRGAAKAAGKKPATEDKPIALNSTQSVVVALANMLPKATYHVFVDNLFSSSDLFRSPRKHGHGAAGTARV
ncbi:hypothetical protein MRS44_018427 [Fusarium solani]|uniref:uncharacterized protein n=1 Tax=Fusarium solani TaxID=169388 RepID=UPI0032C3FA80|nr:hypothetical protein MRS44_018427 [Fusarium solani]